MLDVFVRCGDHATLYNYFNLILKNLGMFNVTSFCHLHSFFARCFYPIVEFFVLRKQKRNKLPTTTTTTTTATANSTRASQVFRGFLSPATSACSVHPSYLSLWFCQESRQFFTSPHHSQDPKNYSCGTASRSSGCVCGGRSGVCVPACMRACVLACVRACVLACVRACVRIKRHRYPLEPPRKYPTVV